MSKLLLNNLPEFVFNYFGNFKCFFISIIFVR